jgi:hypothetical protein
MSDSIVHQRVVWFAWAGVLPNAIYYYILSCVYSISRVEAFGKPTDIFSRVYHVFLVLSLPPPCIAFDWAPFPKNSILLWKYRKSSDFDVSRRDKFIGTPLVIWGALWLSQSQKDCFEGFVPFSSWVEKLDVRHPRMKFICLRLSTLKYFKV